MRTVKLSCLIIMLLALVSCERNPIDRLHDPFPDGALNTYSGVLVVYGTNGLLRPEDLNTGGNVAFIPSDLTPPDNHQYIDFKITDENPPAGDKCLVYKWDGQDLWWDDATVPFKGYEHTWAGVTLIVATHWSLYNTTPGKDLRGGGYTQIKFWAKGNIDSNTTVKFEGPVGGRVATDYIRVNNTQLTSTWKEYSIPLTLSDLGNVKDYFKIVLEYNGTGYGNGGTVFVDDVRYMR